MGLELMEKDRLKLLLSASGIWGDPLPPPQQQQQQQQQQLALGPTMGLEGVPQQQRADGSTGTGVGGLQDYNTFQYLVGAGRGGTGVRGESGERGEREERGGRRVGGLAWHAYKDGGCPALVSMLPAPPKA